MEKGWSGNAHPDLESQLINYSYPGDGSSQKVQTKLRKKTGDGLVSPELKGSIKNPNFSFSNLFPDQKVPDATIPEQKSGSNAMKMIRVPFGKKSQE
ncbi:MAG: hypothetical protein ACYCOO_05495 [Chitinophagaceae bacterium]